MTRIPIISTRLHAIFAWLKVHSRRRPYVRLAVLSSAATATAWALGTVLPQVSAVVAAITALVAVRPTFHAAIQESMRQVFGVILGGALAYVALQSVGLSYLGLFFAIGGAFIVARLLQLGEEGGAAIGVTIILMIGPSGSPEALEARLFGVVIGSLIALFVSLATRPGLPHRRALDDALEEAETVSSLLTEISEHLARHDGALNPQRSTKWLNRAESSLRRVAEIRTDAEEAVAGSRWSPMVARADAQAVLRQVLLTRATALTVVNICRDLHHAAQQEQSLPEELASSLSEVFEATAGLISDQAETARENPAEMLAVEDDMVVASLETQQEATATVRDLEDTQPILIGGSLLRDSAKITDILTDN